jgi:hypothetical protein
MGLPTWAKRKLEESWPASLSEAITKVENFSDVGRSDKSGFKKDNKFVATLALACDQGKGVARCGPRSRPESHITYSRECKECEGMSPHTPK